MSTKQDVTGIKEDELESKGRASLEAALGQKTQEQKQETKESKEPETSEEPKQTQPQSESKETQDATDSELSKFDNILINTYGFDESEINDKVRKVAKSWAGIQSTATKTKQEAQQYKQYIDQLNDVIESYPSLGQKLEQAVNGQYKENPTSNGEPQQGQPQQPNKGQLDYDDISEDTLVSEGYLSKDGFDGLDEATKMRKIMRAEAKYIADKNVNDFRQQIKQEQQNLQKQKETEQIQKENERRATQGFDEFVANHGVNFAELDDEVMQQIQKKMVVTLDPDNPRMISEDAFEYAAKSVLPKYGVNLQQPVSNGPKKSINQIEDTGKTFSKATKQQGEKTLEDQLRERAQRNASQSVNPKQQFNERYGNVSF